MTRGGDWNGWAQPLFIQSEGIRIVEAFQRNGMVAAFDVARDVFRFDDGESDAEEYGSVVDGKRLYPIGSAVWCWFELDYQVATGTASTKPHSGRL